MLYIYTYTCSHTPAGGAGQPVPGTAEARRTTSCPAQRTSSCQSGFTANSRTKSLDAQGFDPVRSQVPRSDVVRIPRVEKFKGFPLCEGEFTPKK